MTLAATLQAGALGASALLGMELRWRGITVLAFLAALLEMALAFGAIYVSVRGVALATILGGVLVVTGVLGWRYAESKLAVSAATVVIVAGGARFIAGWW